MHQKDLQFLWQTSLKAYFYDGLEENDFLKKQTYQNFYCQTWLSPLGRSYNDSNDPVIAETILGTPQVTFRACGSLLSIIHVHKSLSLRMDAILGEQPKIIQRQADE